MKKNYVFQWTIVLSLLSCILFSCKYANEYQTINANNQFSVSVPSWMKEENNLAGDAPFQYANRFRNLYAIGFALNKDTAKSDLNFYWNRNLGALKSALKKPLVTDSISVEVGGLKGVRAEILGTMDGEHIFFSEVFLEGKTKYYHLSIWVRGDERKLRFKEDINRIIASFKEL